MFCRVQRQIKTIFNNNIKRYITQNDTLCVSSSVVQPQECSAAKLMWGSNLLSHIANISTVSCSKLFHRCAILRSIIYSDFKKPIFVGRIININSRICNITKHTATVESIVRSRNFKEPETQIRNHTLMTFVCTDIDLNKGEFDPISFITPTQQKINELVNKWIKQSKEMEHYEFQKSQKEIFDITLTTPPFDTSLSYSELNYIVQPKDLNCYQICNSQLLMSLVEQSGRNSCTKISRSRCLLRCVRSFNFNSPIKCNEIITVRTQVTRSFYHSMEVAVEIRSRNVENPSKEKIVANGFLTYIPVDFQERPRRCPKLMAKNRYDIKHIKLAEERKVFIRNEIN